MDDKRIKEGIDCCRPGSQDVQLPEMADLARELAGSPALRAAHHRLQQLDARIGQALDDVPVPVGLSQRLLVRLREAQPQVEPVATPAAPAARQTSRRAWLWTSAAVAASVLVAVSGWWYFQPRRVSGVDVPELANAWLQALGDDWSALPAAKGLEVPRVIALRPQGWQWVDKSIGHQGVAYRFMLPGGGQATLFVVKMSIERAPTAPPSRPQPTTGDRSLATWQSDGVVYVLVLKGDGRDYQRIFKSVPGTTA